MSTTRILIALAVLWAGSCLTIYNWTDVTHNGATDLLIQIFNALDHHEGSVVGLATIALALFTWRLWWSTEKLVLGADDTAKRQLRAYVDVFSSRVLELNGDRGPRVRLTIKNSGKTPARDVVVWSGVGFFKYPLDEPIIGYGEALKYFPRYPISPGGRIRQYNYLNRRLTAAELDSLEAGTMAIYVIGRIEYKDTFGHSRYSSFKLYLSGRTNIGERSKLSRLYEGNDAD